MRLSFKHISIVTVLTTVPVFAGIRGAVGDFYVVGRFSVGVYQYDGSSGTVVANPFANGSGGILQEPTDAVFSPHTGALLISTVGDVDNPSRVVEFDGVTGGLIGDFVTAGLGGLSNASSLVFGPDNNLYVASRDNDKVLRFDGYSGAMIDTFVVRASGGLHQPSGIVFGPDGNLYVASFGTSQVLKYHGVTGVCMGTFVSAGSGGLTGPHDLVFGPNGNLFVCDSAGHVIEYDGNTGGFVKILVNNGLGGFLGLAFGANGCLFVSIGSEDKVIEYNGGTGAYVKDFVVAGTSALDGPQGILFRPDYQPFEPPYPTGDFDRSYKVDFKDLAVIAETWLDCTGPDAPCYYGQ